MLVTLLLIIVTAVSFIPYSKYKEVQEFAVASLLASAADEFSDVKDDYNALVKEMYKFLKPHSWSTTINGYKLNNSAAVDAADTADKTLGDLIEKAGYGPCIRGSNYLEYVGYMDYTTNKFAAPFIVWVALAAVLLLINLLYAIDRRKSFTIEKDRIICMNGKKTVKEFFIRDINSVEATKLSGLKIRGNAIRYKINLLQNSDELKSEIMASLAEASLQKETTPSTQNTSLDDLKKYKELLDMGAITQQEFDGKKHKLLDL